MLTSCKAVALVAFLFILGCAGHRVHNHADDSHADAEYDSALLPNKKFSREDGNIPGPKFDWPVDEARMTRGFFLKDPRGHSRRPHFGIDLAAPKKTPIYAAHNGTVIYVGREFRGFGRMIMIEGKGGWATLYAHLSKARVKEGQSVRQGDLIGDMGRTGRATGVHLHFEIRKQSGPVDPMLFLPQVQVAHHSRVADDAAGL